MRRAPLPQMESISDVAGGSGRFFFFFLGSALKPMVIGSPPVTAGTPAQDVISWIFRIFNRV